jgi:DNA-binding transcriptional LysR family regulator
VPRDDVSLRDLKALALILEVGSLTRAAESMNVSQPSLSKALRRLRLHFGDPLLVRVGLSMRPTTKAVQLVEPLRSLLSASERLRSTTHDLNPAVSDREFTVLVTEVGMIELIPRLMRRLEERGPNLRLRALPLDSRPFQARHEAGEADIAIGAFPGAAPTLRRQRLYVDRFSVVVRRGHPCLGELSEISGFRAARHIVVVASSTGHAAHRRLEKALGTEIGSNSAQVRVPSFLAAAFLASRTDGVATIPGKLAETLAGDLGLELCEPPFALEPIQIDQFWHERVQQDKGHRWFRSEVFDLFGSPS